MKKIVLTWFASCLLLTGVSAQNTFAVSYSVHQYGIKKVQVSGNSRLHVVYAGDSVPFMTLKAKSNSALQTKDLFRVVSRNDSYLYRKLANPNDEDLRELSRKQVLELLEDNMDYELMLGRKDVVDIHGEGQADIIFSSLDKEVPSFTVELEDSARFRFEPSAQQLVYAIQRLSVSMEDYALFEENMPLEMGTLISVCEDFGKYVEYADTTGNRKIRNKVVLSLEEKDKISTDSLSSDSSVMESAFRQMWNAYGDMLEDIVDLKHTEWQRPNYWHTRWNLYWGFLGWKGDASAFFPYLWQNEASDMHISFSSFTWEIKECYRFKYRHEVGFGLGVSWDNYRLPTPDNNHISNIAGDSLNSTFKKGKIRVGYVQVPIGYTYERGGFNFSLEVIPGYAMKSICKTKWNSSESKYIFKQGINDMVEPWKLDARLTLGWTWGSIFVQPSLLPVITDNGKSIYPVRAGFRINL